MSDFDYIQAAINAYKESDSLAHYGIEGQKWGVRRYQNEDGTLTEEGKRRYGSGDGVTKDQMKKDAAKGEWFEKASNYAGDRDVTGIVKKWAGRQAAAVGSMTAITVLAEIGAMAVGGIPAAAIIGGALAADYAIAAISDYDTAKAVTAFSRKKMQNAGKIDSIAGDY